MCLADSNKDPRSWMLKKQFLFFREWYTGHMSLQHVASHLLHQAPGLDSFVRRLRPLESLESRVVRIIVGSLFFFSAGSQVLLQTRSEISGKIHVWCHEATRRYGAAARFS